MSDPAGESAATTRRLPTTRVAPVSATVVLPGVLLVAPALDGPEAAATVGLVLAEAIALYVGYGALTRVAGPIVRELLASE